MSKEPNKHQLSSRLQYNQTTPAFLQKLQNRIAGIPDDEEDEEEEYAWDGTGRPPIPQRPAVPSRPADDPGSADEDDIDEKPQVVVLKEGKHLTEREAENVKRKERGLPPIPDPTEAKVQETNVSSSKSESASNDKPQHAGLSFSSKPGAKAPSLKRKAVGDADDTKISKQESKLAKKKAKKAGKSLLSFGDADDI